MSANLPQNKRLLGFTLVETLVAMAISSILVLGVIQIFSISKSTNKVNDALSRVQDNARYAMDKLLSDIRKSGYVGCTPNINSFINDAGTPNEDLYDMNNATGGWEYTDTDTYPGAADYTIENPINTSAQISYWDNSDDGDLPAGLDGEVVKGTDLIVLKWVDPIDGVNFDGDNNAINTSELITTTAHKLPQVPDGDTKKGRVVVVGNCRGADAFITVPNGNKEITRAIDSVSHVLPANAGLGEWSQVWGESAQFMIGTNRVYYIGEAAGGGPALFAADYQFGTNAIRKTEIAEGIENMQILYGEDTTTDGVLNQYKTAEDVDHSKVVAVQIGLIARSLDPVLKAGNSRTLDVIGLDVITPADSRLRYVFTSTIKLRN